jgi:hypothetical protein
MTGNQAEHRSCGFAGCCGGLQAVGERCYPRRSRTVTSGGAIASDYAGMSNDKTGENPVRRKPKVSWGRYIRPGLVGSLVEAERRRRWAAG